MKAKAEIEALTSGYAEQDRLLRRERWRARLSRIAAVAYPNPVIVRMSDFKTNEYAELLGGRGFEPKEENPMIGFRGASRYYSDAYREGFALECKAIAIPARGDGLRQRAGHDPVLPHAGGGRQGARGDGRRTGLSAARTACEVYVMCEIPSNVIRAEEFAERFDGFSIGSNDLTQLTLGVDRDSGELAAFFDERDPAVQWMIETVIERAHAAGSKVGLLRSGAVERSRPLRSFWSRPGIDSISVTPDSFVAVKEHVAEAE
jgi:pyruvate,water dikinase